MNSLNVPESNLERIVVIGCGFAGLHLVRKLRKHPFQIVMLDKHNYHTFQPLLYQVATAGLEPDSIAYPIRNIFRGQKNFYYRMAIVEEIDSSRSTIRTNIGELDYDHLVIATGSSTNYFGIPNMEEESVPMKTVPEALNLRSIILQNFEAASLTPDLRERERLMNFVIVGAGPTGVELAGALAELKTHVLPNDYPDLDFRRMSIHLLEGMDRVLPPMSKSASATAHEYLDKLGVQIWTRTMVKGYDGELVKTEKKELPASTLIWAAGVKGTIIPGLPSETVEKGRYLVNEFNQVKSFSNIFALGDVAAMKSEEYPQGHPMLAQVAIQQGSLLADNFVRQKRGKALQAFKYKDYGTMATVGRNKAVADISKLHFGGFIGWLLWGIVHLRGLVGFRNRLVVLMNWVVNYLTYDKKIRLIIRPVKRRSKPIKDVAEDHREAVEKP